MELRFAPLFSGSSGNAVYVGCDAGHLLVDAGMSCARVLEELKRVGVNPADLGGLVITHEHIDHIRGAGVLSRKLDLPIYATPGTWAAMEDKLGAVAEKNIRTFQTEQDFFIGGINVQSFPTPHDAAESVGYCFTVDGKRFSVATDLGCVRDSWMNYVRGSDAVLLESNYDPDMLRAGRYPYDLKKRIMSRKGHLSNDDAGETAAELIRSGARQIVLGHLSKENNFPELAERSCICALQQAGIVPGEDALLCVAKRDGATGMFVVTD